MTERDRIVETARARARMEFPGVKEEVRRQEEDRRWFARYGSDIDWHKLAVDSARISRRVGE